MSDERNGSALAEANATLPDALAMHALTVIGLIRTNAGTSALLRSARGQIARVQVGQQAFGRQVTAIGDDQILLTNRWGQTEALTLPRG